MIKRLIRKSSLDPNLLKFPINEIGPRIQIARVNKNMTVSRLADLVGIDQGNLSKIETGLYNNGNDINRQLVERIVNALGITINELLQIDTNDPSLQTYFNLKEVGPKIRKVRMDQNMSIAELAGRIGVYPSKISGIENGQYNNSINIGRNALEKIVAALGITIKDLLQVHINLNEVQYYDVKEVGPKIRAARVNKGMEIKELATLVNTTRGSISRIETGIYSNGTISARLLEQIVNALGITVDELLQIDHTIPSVQMTFPVTKVGPKIRIIRKQKNMTIPEVAQLSHIDVGSLSTIETGTYNNGGNIGKKLLQRILSTLGITIDDLVKVTQ